MKEHTITPQTSKGIWACDASRSPSATVRWFGRRIPQKAALGLPSRRRRRWSGSVGKFKIDFRNKRPGYLSNFLDKLVNWENVASRM